ncbi:MAG: hypothetical protein EGP82_08680 [Odoribacter splanchnicus]|nr:hypothetical protein [Odoribacter splanchnicus]
MEIYTVKVAVKPYVRAYLENNFGKPADIRKDAELNELVNFMLREGSTRLDKIVSANFKDMVELRITEDAFFRNGFTFTKTETLKFNSFLEKRIKFFMRTYISYHHSLGDSVARCIRDFQTVFGFTEEVWPYDSIKKDFDRNGALCERRMIGNFKEELSRLFLEGLSEIGTPFRAVGIDLQLNTSKNG